jgi:hypothetical protein
MTRKKKINKYRVERGFNVRLPNAKGKFGDGIVKDYGSGPEVRFDIGMEVREDELPKQADVGWLIAKGCLVVIDVIDPSPPKSKKKKVSAQEDADG